MNRLCLFGSLTAALCAASTALAQDECAAAPTLVSGIGSAFNTTTATTSIEAVDDSQCAGTFLNWGTANKDVWFKWTASASGTIDVTTCLTGSFDTSIVLYEGSCGALTQVACNGDGPGNGGCQNYYSQIAGFAVTPGSTYFVRIGGYDDGSGAGPEFGAGQLTLTFTEGFAGCPSAGGCDVAHATPGCEDTSCCNTVCSLLPDCCSVAWDQTCVDIAIPECGYYVCTPGAIANDCATNATLVTASGAYPFSTVGATMDGPDHPGSTCNSGSDIFDHDIWWKIVAPANGTLTLSTCGAVSYDNKLAVYDLGTDPASFNYNDLDTALIGCNDDGASGACNTTSDPPTTYASEMSATVAVGRTYLIRNGSYAAGETGFGTLTITLPQPCQIESGSAESEACGDSFNDGCNSAGGPAENIALDGVVNGSFWADAGTRDTDFYRFSVAAPSTVRVEVKSTSLATVLLLQGDLTVADCGGVQVLGQAGSGTCPTATEYCLLPGTYYAFVAAASFEGLPCGTGNANNYSVKVSATPAVCPITLSGGFDGSTTQPGVCDNPGPDSYVASAAPTTSGLVACAVNPAFPNCSGGGTTANSYAKVIPAGQMSGDISCLNMGVFCVVRDVNSTNTACANYISDLALPAKIGVYADLDGGNPRFKTADGGVDGGDLELIEQVDVLVNGGVYMATLNWPEPVCVSDYTDKNLVVIMDIPDFFAGQPGVPAASGYGLRPSGSTVTGQGSGTFVRLSCADSGAYVLAESLGATFTAQWAVTAIGTDGSTCGAPACPGDFNADGLRNGADLGFLLANWGTPGADLNADGTTNGADLGALLAVFNLPCN